MKEEVDIKTMSEIENVTNEERKLFQENMLAREAIISLLSKSEFTEVEDLIVARDILKRLETLYEGDEHAKQAKLEYWKTKMEGRKMREDESIRAYSQRVNEVVVGIKNCGGTYTNKEVMVKIIRSVTPAFKAKAQMI